MENQTSAPAQGKLKKVGTQTFVPKPKYYHYKPGESISSFLLACTDEANILLSKMQFIEDFPDYNIEDLGAAGLIYSDVLHDFRILTEALKSLQKRLSVEVAA